MAVPEARWLYLVGRKNSELFKDMWSMRGRARDRIQVYTTAKSIYFLEMPHSRTQNMESLRFNSHKS